MRPRSLVFFSLLLAACGNDNGTEPPPPPNLTGVLAYIGDGIIIRNLANDNTRRIALPDGNLGAVFGALTWQPDGRALVYAPFNLETSRYELHRVPVDGSPATVLYPTEGQHQAFPAFAPDGRLGYWVNGFEHGHQMFVDGKPFPWWEELCMPSRPAWSPDGPAMLVVGRDRGVDRLVRVDLATGSAVVVFQAGDQSVEQLVNPAYSRAGDRVAFTRLVFGQNNSETDEIWVINADGSSPSRLTSGHSDDMATWSPDDAWIAFARNDAGGGIEVVSATGGSVAKLAEGGAPAWR